MRLNDRQGWGLVIGVGALLAVGTGRLVGQDVVDAMNPFYFNGAGTSRYDSGPQVVDASFLRSDTAVPDTADLYHGRGEGWAGDVPGRTDY